jgi:TonB-linked SusC/RagA family outer membrane protein
MYLFGKSKKNTVSEKKLVLRWVCVFVWMGFFFTAENAYAQSKSISITVKDAALETALKQIENQCEYSFFYADKIDLSRKVSINEKNRTLNEVLNLLFGNTDIVYKFKDKQIILQQKEKEKPAKTQQQMNTVTGAIFDETGEEIAGAIVTVKGTTRGVSTDLDGTFSIQALPTDQLEVSFLGYQPYNVSVGQQTYINITLVPQTNELDEVTVVAFGKQKKASVIGSIATVNVNNLKVPSSNLTTALAGRISGLISYQRSGEPGQDDASFFVRGVTTFSYANAPLILIDGVEMTSSDLSRLQTDDIASFSIMKDAAATALYGARGANGVIMVTTKEGQEGRAQVSFRYETSASTPTRNVDLADPISYMRMNNEAVLNRDPMRDGPYSLEKIENTIAGKNKYVYPANDWYNMLFKNYTVNHRANFSVSGGGKVARYYIAGTFNQDNGSLKVDGNNNFNNNINLKKYLLRSNVNINITPTTEAIVRLHGTFDDYSGPIDGGSDLYNKVVRADPVLFPAYYASDENTAHIPYTLFGNYDKGQYINPYADMVKGYKEYSKSLMLAQFELKQDLNFITKGLSLRGLFNINRYAYFDVNRFYTPHLYKIGGYNKFSDSYTLSWINPTDATNYLSYNEGLKDIIATTYFEGAVNYDRTFLEKHAISGLLVGTARTKLTPNASTLALSLPSRNVGLSGRFTYSFDSRYFTEFNFGYNGSERFSKNERFGFFPSVGAAWIVSNESFWNEQLHRIFSKLKLKATYGLVGNDAIGNLSDRFFYLSEVNVNTSARAFTWGKLVDYTVPGVTISRYANDKITWETSEKMNTGIELELFGKLEIQAEYYTEYRKNILMTRANMPTTMGLQAIPITNVGEAKGKGIDLSADYNHSFNKDFWITGRANFTYATANYQVYEELDNAATPWLSRVGQPISQTWGYVAERLFVDESDKNNNPVQSFGEYGAGDIKYRDINGDDKIDVLDQVPIGYPTQPEIIYGFGISTGYKNFDFSCFFQGLARESFWINTGATAGQSTVPFIDTDNNDNIISKNALLQAYADNHWSQDDRNLYALWPAFSDKLSENNFGQLNTWFMRDGSFLRLKSLEMGYTLPKRWTNRYRVKNLRIYFSGTNLLTFSKFKLWDPEMAGSGLTYPIQKVYNAGIQVSF